MEIHDIDNGNALCWPCCSSNPCHILQHHIALPSAHIRLRTGGNVSWDSLLTVQHNLAKAKGNHQSPASSMEKWKKWCKTEVINLFHSQNGLVTTLPTNLPHTPVRLADWSLQQVEMQSPASSQDINVVQPAIFTTTM